jgi:hypothetical protein
MILRPDQVELNVSMILGVKHKKPSFDGFLARCGFRYPSRRRDAAALSKFVLSFIIGITSFWVRLLRRRMTNFIAVHHPTAR